MLKFTTPLLATLLFSGCSLAPRYEQPTADVATTYPIRSERVVGADIEVLPWSEFFGDVRLRAVIQLALDHNTDLQVAALRVQRVRALYGIQRTALLPTLNATADGARQLTPSDLSGSGAAVTSGSHQVGFDLPSYELDFFGRVASLRDQVLQEYLASEAAARSARISLISAVARQYLTTLALDEQFELAEQTLASAVRAYDLNHQSFTAGVASELDLATAEAQRESVRATLASLEAQRDQAHHALTLLVGTPLPDDLPPVGSLATQNLMHEMPVGLPADLLTNRPDILEAEHTLQAANANIGVARAAFFPSIKLTANGGTASADLEGLFESGSGAWRFAPSITVPIFAAGANRARLEIAGIEKRIEVINYQRVIQTAFREVADALAVRRSIVVEINAQSARVAAAQRREDLSAQRFEAGIDSYLTVLLAQQERYSAQQALIQARLTESTNLTGLYAALGGG